MTDKCNSSTIFGKKLQNFEKINITFVSSLQTNLEKCWSFLRIIQHQIQYSHISKTIKFTTLGMNKITSMIEGKVKESFSG